MLKGKKFAEIRLSDHFKWINLIVHRFLFFGRKFSVWHLLCFELLANLKCLVMCVFVCKAKVYFLLTGMYLLYM